jgi:hypothetical protein
LLTLDEAIEDRKRRLEGLLRLRHDGLALNETFSGVGCPDLQARLRGGLRRDRIETAGHAVPRRPFAALAQDQEPGSAGRQAAR